MNDETPPVENTFWGFGQTVRRGAQISAAFAEKGHSWDPVVRQNRGRDSGASRVSAFCHGSVAQPSNADTSLQIVYLEIRPLTPTASKINVASTASNHPANVDTGKEKTEFANKRETLKTQGRMAQSWSTEISARLRHQTNSFCETRYPDNTEA